MKTVQQIFLASLVPLLLAGCGASGVETTDGGTYSGDQQGDDNSTDWAAIELVELGENGLLKPNIQTILVDNELHVFYYDAHTVVEGETFDFGEEFDAVYDLMYLVWDVDAGEIVIEPEVVEVLDNSSGLSAAYDASSLQPNVIYQGGDIVDSCQVGQGNIMVSSEDSLGWYDETAAIGLVERTVDVLSDGLVGGSMDIAIDSDGNQHISYQFHYEGCDGINLNYPDLHYVLLDANTDYSSLENDAYAALEESVDGNLYSYSSGVLSGAELNVAGGVNSIVINDAGIPIILYSHQQTNTDAYGLKVAVRNEADDWSIEWIDEFEDCVVEGIDAALNPEGYISAAVYTYGCESDDDERDDDWHKLHYLTQTASGWTVEPLYTTKQIGQYPSLAFDGEGNPMIAYYEIETYSGSELTNLAVAYKEDGSWDLQEVSNYSDIGKYNQLKITDEGKALLVSYYDAGNSILLFEKDL
ncbi:hypothetical protein [Reinekea marinisedimentorum]|uniref:Uncharacterized protein n=1 Tax=Reinekea marinisedimentorum TaxID=230495 RepID=A0A4R3I5J5_9GAMM|nr:hypothetical protein [Reinekea marinisedimentorum]TCS40223.1 hypothetical protein BCF53_110145 [Reinekea marinisedimentorum]